jgi:hypothetical protein
LENCQSCHCDDRREEAIPTFDHVGDCFAALAVTVSEFSNSIVEGLAVQESILEEEKKKGERER